MLATKSDAVVCAQLCPICPARGWGVVWLVISMGFWAGGAFSCCMLAATSIARAGRVDGDFSCSRASSRMRTGWSRIVDGPPPSGTTSLLAVTLRAMVAPAASASRRLERGTGTGWSRSWGCWGTPRTPAETQTPRDPAGLLPLFWCQCSYAIDSGRDFRGVVRCLSSPLRAASTHAIQSEKIEGLVHDMPHHGMCPAEEIQADARDRHAECPNPYRTCHVQEQVAARHGARLELALLKHRSKDCELMGRTHCSPGRRNRTGQALALLRIIACHHNSTPAPRRRGARPR